MESVTRFVRPGLLDGKHLYTNEAPETALRLKETLALEDSTLEPKPSPDSKLWGLKAVQMKKGTSAFTCLM